MGNEIDVLFSQLDDDELPALPDQDELPPVPVARPLLDVEKHVRRHEAISDEILSSWRSDREEAQQAINTVRGIIDDCLQNNRTPPGTVLEAYVGALKAKADTNAIAVRLLDASTKLMQTSKPNIKVSQTTHNNNIDLGMILSNPIRPDDV